MGEAETGVFLAALESVSLPYAAVPNKSPCLKQGKRKWSTVKISTCTHPIIYVHSHCTYVHMYYTQIHTHDNKWWQELKEGAGILIHCSQGWKLQQLLLKPMWRFLKMKNRTTGGSGYTYPSMTWRNPSQQPKETPTTSVFIAACIATAKLWDQPRCPSTNEQIKKIWDKYTAWSLRMKLYHRKRDEQNWRASC